MIIGGDIICILLWNMIDPDEALVVHSPLRFSADIVLSLRDFPTGRQDEDFPGRLLSRM